MADKTLLQMAKFDFSAPVETIMVFEDDSDDEIHWSPKRLKVADSNTNVSLDSEMNIINSTNNENLQKVTKTINNCIIEYNLLDVKKASGSITHQLPNKAVITNHDKVHNNDKQQNILLDNTPKSVANEENKTKESLPEQVDTVTSVNHSKQYNDAQLMSSYLKKIITNVSEYLVIILKEHGHYLYALKTGNQTFIEKMKEHYMKVKYHFFKLSFVIVESIFIPNSHSDTFDRSFIESTARFASRKSLNYTYEQIKPHYLEMIEWTKEKSKIFKKFSLPYTAPEAPISPSTIYPQLGKTTSEETKKTQKNIYAPQLDKLHINKSVNLGSGHQNIGDVRVCNQNQLSYPVLKSLIRPTLPSYKQAMHSRHRNIGNVNHPYGNYYRPQDNACWSERQLSPPCHNYNYSISNGSHPGYMTSPISELNQNCVYCQQPQWNYAIQQQTLPIPVISRVTSLDPNHTPGCRQMPHV